MCNRMFATQTIKCTYKQNTLKLKWKEGNGRAGPMPAVMASQHASSYGITSPQTKVTKTMCYVWISSRKLYGHDVQCFHDHVIYGTSQKLDMFHPEYCLFKMGTCTTSTGNKLRMPGDSATELWPMHVQWPISVGNTLEHRTFQSGNRQCTQEESSK